MTISAISEAERRALGRFDTPRPLAQAITDWAVRSASDRVLEPSCGGGEFVKSIIARLAELGAEDPSQQIWACDIDQRALNETLQSVAPNKPQLTRGNFLRMKEDAFDYKPFDVIIGNPPYIRLHAMDEESRSIARESLSALDVLDCKASLWAYFPIHSIKFLTVDGKMAWILPEAVLHTRYGKELLTWASRKFNNCIAVSLRERCFKTVGAKERVVILLLSGAGMGEAPGIEMIEFSTAIDCIEALPTLGLSSPTNFPMLNGHAIPHLLSDGAADAAGLLTSSPEIRTFGEFAEVKIGVVTGNNKFFILTEQQRSNLKLKRYHFKRTLAKFCDLGNGFSFTKKEEERILEDPERKIWLLCPNQESVDQKLHLYLNTYLNDDIGNNQTMAKRAFWQRPTLGEVPHAFFRYMGKLGPRIILNETENYCTNTIHRVYFTKSTTKQMRRAICLSLHSSYSQLSSEFEGRQYGSGVLKHEPSEAKQISIVLNPALIVAFANMWPQLVRKASIKGWEIFMPEIDATISQHCPNLNKQLPLAKVHALLKKVRDRRASIHLSERL